MATSCPGCGAPVDIAVDAHTGERIALETYTDSSSDAERYRIVELGPPLKVLKVSEGTVGDLFPVHSYDCPAQNDGQRR